jgi:hypothetical protein
LGVGDSLEAPFTLRGPIAAGTWRLVGDGIITGAVDVHFEVVWRKASGGGDTVLAAWDHHFDPRGGGNFDAVPFEATAQGPAAPAKAGDLLVLRMVISGTTQPTAYIPNGDGPRAKGRIPSIELP